MAKSHKTSNIKRYQVVLGSSEVRLVSTTPTDIHAVAVSKSKRTYSFKDMSDTSDGYCFLSAWVMNIPQRVTIPRLAILQFVGFRFPDSLAFSFAGVPWIVYCGNKSNDFTGRIRKQENSSLIFNADLGCSQEEKAVQLSAIAGIDTWNCITTARRTKTGKTNSAYRKQSSILHTQVWPVNKQVLLILLSRGLI